MAPRTRSSPVQKASWRGRGGPVSSSLLFYRRLVMTTLSVALLGGFALLIRLNWTANPAPLAASLHLSDYSRGAAPPLAFADRDAQAIQSLLADRFRTVVALGENQTADAQNIERALAFDEAAFSEASPKATLLVYVAAHGCSQTVESGANEDQDEAFLLPVNFDPGDPAKAGLPVSKLLAAIARQPPKTKVLAIDFGSIEHDLRLGTAVNRFSDVLARELDKIDKLKSDERLVVITSHRTWERSIVVPGENPRSVFGYYFGAALGEPGHEEDHADLTRYDGGRPDKRISVAELVWFVQRQVSDWVWINTDFQRTQHPLVLVKRGATPVVRLELADPSEMPEKGSDAAKELSSLAEIYLCRTPTKPSTDAGAEKKGDKPAETEKAANNLPRPAHIFRPALASSAIAQSPKTEAAPAEAAAAIAPATKATASPATTPPAVKVEDLRPAWLREQAQELALLVGPDANPWLPVSSVRAQTAALLDRQQRTLAGLSPRNDGGGSSRLNGLAGPADWPPKSLDTINTAEWIKSVRSRNAVLLQLPLLTEGAERLEGESGQRAREKLRALVAAVDSMIDLLDRNVLLQSMANTPATLYRSRVATADETDVTLLTQPQTELEAAYRELLAEFRAALQSPAAGDAVAWLNAWELGQALPLALVESKAELAINSPKLAVQPPPKAGERPAREPRSGITRQGVPDKIAARRRSWLEIQARIANKLDSTLPKGDATAAGAAGSLERQLNQTALAIRDRHESAAKALAAFDGSRSQRAADHWIADRTARLVQALVGEAVTSPFPPEKIVPAPPRVLLSIAPLHIAASEGGADHAAVLSLDKPLKAQWELDADADVLSRVLVEISYEPADLIVTDRQGRSVPPFQAGMLPRVSELMDGNLLALQVRAKREVGVDEAKQANANRKELSVKLRLDEQSVSAPVAFRLPDSRYLDVLVAGHRATLERGPDESGLALPDGWSWRRAAPDDAAIRRGRAGDFRLEVSPFPRGQSHFRLKLVNRAEKPRKLVAIWHVPKAGTTAITDWLKWQQVIDEGTSLKIRAPAAESKQVAAGEPWEPPLFVTPPAAGAAAAPPPAPLPDVLNIESGLLCVLTDELEPGWQQRIWLRARPLHPQEYLEMSARFRPAPPKDAVVVSLNSTSAIRSQLPPAELEVKWFELADDRILPPPPAPRDFSLASDQPPITAEIAPGVRLTSSSLLEAILEIDGYPRAAHFPAIPRIGEPVEHRREPYVQLQLFEETAPSVAAPPDSPAPAPRPLAKREAFKRVPRLGYAVFADFADRRGQSLRLTQNGNVGSALARFPLDRRFVVRCRKPPDPSGPQLTVDCEVQEWAGSLGSDIRWLRPGRNIIRAEIVEMVAGQEQPLEVPEASAEYVVVLDTVGPQIVSQMRPKFERFVGEKVEISFSVSDSDPGQEDDASGVDVGQIMWGTGVDNKATAIVTPQPIAPLLDPESIKPGQQTFRCELAETTKQPGQLKIYIQATDRAGNPSRPVAICEIDVRKPRTLDNRGGAGKQAVGK